MLGRCYACKGNGKVTGLGCIEVKCRNCKGSGEAELPVNTVVSTLTTIDAIHGSALTPEFKVEIVSNDESLPVKAVTKVGRKVFKRVKS